MNKLNDLTKALKLDDPQSSKRKTIKMEASTSDSLKVGNSFVYDFDVWEVEGQVIIGVVVENRYLIYSMERDPDKIVLLKEEEIKLVEEVSILLLSKMVEKRKQ
jgi:hypothetical protein